jgi:hypothetical protein
VNFDAHFCPLPRRAVNQQLAADALGALVHAGDAQATFLLNTGRSDPEPSSVSANTGIEQTQVDAPVSCLLEHIVGALG